MERIYLDLDKVLESYVKDHKSILSDSEINTNNITIKHVCKALDIETNEKTILKSLIQEGYIQRNPNSANGEPYKATTDGIQFFTNGGYKEKYRVVEIDKRIKENELNNGNLEKFKFIVPLIFSLIAICISAYSLYLNFKENNPIVSLTNEKLISTNFIDLDGRLKYSSKSVTLIGLKPHEKTGLIVTTYKDSNTAYSPNVPYRIFEINNLTSTDSIIKNPKMIASFRDEGLEKIGLMNKVIPSGEIYVITVGVVFDLYSDTTKKYSSIIFTSELHFSNGQVINFGAGGDL
jgi:hypothetical protein